MSQFPTLRPVAATIALALGAGPSFAQLEDDTIACFGRAYSADHLAAHPGQRVVEMQIVMDAGFSGERQDHVGPSMVETTLRATTRDRYGEFFANSAVCPWNGDEARYECGIECDGGSFDIALADDGTAILTNTNWGFILYGSCGEDVAASREVRIPADEDHAEFRLHPMPVETCPVGLWTLYDLSAH